MVIPHLINCCRSNDYFQCLAFINSAVVNIVAMCACASVCVCVSRVYLVYTFRALVVMAKLSMLVYSCTSRSQMCPFPTYLSALEFFKHLNFMQLDGF